jgi:hypothetical protein
VGEKSRFYSWKAVKVDGHVNITIIEKNTSFLTICSTDGATAQWKIKDDDRQSITAERHGKYWYRKSDTTFSNTGVRRG